MVSSPRPLDAPHPSCLSAIFGEPPRPSLLPRTPAFRPLHLARHPSLPVTRLNHFVRPFSPRFSRPPAPFHRPFRIACFPMLSRVSRVITRNRVTALESAKSRPSPPGSAGSARSIPRRTVPGSPPGSGRRASPCAIVPGQGHFFRLVGSVRDNEFRSGANKATKEAFSLPSRAPFPMPTQDGWSAGGRMAAPAPTVRRKRRTALRRRWAEPTSGRGRAWRR